MNITYLIGNGFDINIGMNTRYEDFLEYYLRFKSKDMFIQKAKDEIDKDLKNWADLELALGKYTSQIESQEPDAFFDFYEDLHSNLARYLEIEESRYEYNSLDKNKFLMDLQTPETYLGDTEKPCINALKNTNALKDNNVLNNVVKSNINIITFNYTRSLEKLLALPDNKTEIQIDKFWKITSIEHIHGFTDERMILGVDNANQIENETFRRKIDFIDQLVKPNCNQATKGLHPSICNDMIKNSSVVCMFGLSIGDTDKTWWQRIALWLKGNFNRRLIIFSKSDQDIPRRIIQKKISLERGVKDLFLSQTKLPDESRKVIKDQILVSINSNMFGIGKLSRKNTSIIDEVASAVS